jgi:hypothetical protein
MKKILMIILAMLILFLTPIAAYAGSISLSASNFSYKEVIKTFNYPTIINYTATYAAQNNGNCSIIVANRGIPVWGGTGEFTVPPGTYTFSVSHGGSAGGYVSLSVHYIELIPQDKITLSLDNPITNSYICNPVRIHWINNETASRRYKVFDGSDAITGYLSQTSLSIDLSPGIHNLSVIAYDDWNNPSPLSNKTGEFIVDNTRPIGEIDIKNTDEQPISITKNRIIVIDLSTVTDTGSFQSGLGYMCFSEDNVTYSNWESFNTTKQYIIQSTGDGPKTIYAQVKDFAGNTTVFSKPITLDTQPPVGTISLNSPKIIIKETQKYISNPSVILNLSATDLYSTVVTMQFSDDGINYQPQVPYNTYTTYTLTWDDGLKTVYVKFSDALGNKTIGSTIFDSVILDTSPPSGGIAKVDNSNTNITYINEDNKIFTRDHNLILTLEANDGDGIGVASMSFSNDGINYSEWEPYTITKTWTIDPNGNDGPRTIYTGFRDQLGHEAFVQTEVILDRTPASGSIAVTAEDGWTLNMENPANSLNIKLQVNAQDDLGPIGSNSGVKGVYLWNGASVTRPTDAVYKSLNEIAALVDWTLDEGPDGIRTINMQVIDNTINISETIQVTVALDRIAPGAPQNITHSYSNGVMTFKR